MEGGSGEGGQKNPDLRDVIINATQPIWVFEAKFFILVRNSFHFASISSDILTKVPLLNQVIEIYYLCPEQRSHFKKEVRRRLKFEPNHPHIKVQTYNFMKEYIDVFRAAAVSALVKLSQINRQE